MTIIPDYYDYCQQKDKAKRQQKEKKYDYQQILRSNHITDLCSYHNWDGDKIEKVLNQWIEE